MTREHLKFLFHLQGELLERFIKNNVVIVARLNNFLSQGIELRCQRVKSAQQVVMVVELQGVGQLFRGSGDNLTTIGQSLREHLRILFCSCFNRIGNSLQRAFCFRKQGLHTFFGFSKSRLHAVFQKLEFFIHGVIEVSVGLFKELFNLLCLQIRFASKVCFHLFIEFANLLRLRVHFISETGGSKKYFSSQFIHPIKSFSHFVIKKLEVMEASRDNDFYTIIDGNIHWTLNGFGFLFLGGLFSRFGFFSSLVATLKSQDFSGRFFIFPAKCD